MDNGRNDVAGGIAKQLAAVHRNGGAHKDKRTKKQRFGGKQKRDAMASRN